MNDILTKRLCESFPRLFRRFDADGEINCPFHERSFECGDGWFELLWQLATAIESQAQKEKLDNGDWPRCRQVKNKFNRLRLYLGTDKQGRDGISESIRRLVDKAGDVSEAVAD